MSLTLAVRDLYIVYYCHQVKIKTEKKFNFIFFQLLFFYRELTDVSILSSFIHLRYVVRIMEQYIDMLHRSQELLLVLKLEWKECNLPLFGFYLPLLDFTSKVKYQLIIDSVNLFFYVNVVFPGCTSCTR